jgi:hypothetical protein
MKIIIITLVSLLVGVGIGWYLGYTRPIAQASRDMHDEESAYESGDAKAAAIAIDTISCIDSGDTEKAVQFLSLPIAGYYNIYAKRIGTNEQRLKICDNIEQLARTNQIVAARIKNFASPPAKMP